MKSTDYLRDPIDWIIQDINNTLKVLENIQKTQYKVLLVSSMSLEGE